MKNEKEGEYLFIKKIQNTTVLLADKLFKLLMLVKKRDFITIY